MLPNTHTIIYMDIILTNITNNLSNMCDICFLMELPSSLKNIVNKSKIKKQEAVIFNV